MESKAKRVDILLGTECNENCIFCFNQGIKKRQYRGSFCLEKIESTLSHVAKKGIRKVNISGGEPTISNNYFDTLELCKKHGYDDIRLITNGMMFSYDWFAKKSSAYPIRQVCVSLHSSHGSISDSLTKTKGSHEKTLKGIANIKKYLSHADLAAHVVLTKEIIRGLNQHIEFLIKLGFKSVNLLYLMPNSRINKALAPERNKLAGILKGVIDRHKRKIFIHIGYLEPCLMKGYEEHFDSNDFDMEFITNCPRLFRDWKASLLKSKIAKKDCRACTFLKTCCGHWR